jgi:6-phosphogluconolactonase
MLPQSDAVRVFAFVGSLNRRHPAFPSADGAGISAFHFDAAAGRLSPAGVTGGIDNPTFLLIDSRRAHLYATSEVAEWNEGTVTAFAINRDTGALTYINKQPTRGRAPCYLAFHAAGRHVLVTNYGEGSLDDPPGQAVAILPIRADGGLSPPADSLPAGCGAAGPGPFHPHSAITTPDDRFLLVADAGAGFVSAHAFDTHTDTVARQPASRLDFGLGRVPRHLAFHPGGRVLYATDESACNVATMACKDGVLSLIGTAQMLHHVDPRVTNMAADLAVGRDGRHLYATNRGQDCIATFLIEPGTGRLSLAYVTQTGGTPRSLTLDSSGRFLLVSHQTAQDIEVLAIDPATGAPSPTGSLLAVHSPTCIRLATFDRPTFSPSTQTD